MSRLDGKVVAITGASSGIGAATALELAARGAAVVLGARRTDRLDSLVARIQTEDGRAKTRGKQTCPTPGRRRPGSGRDGSRPG